MIKLDVNVTRIICLSCHSELFRITKYADDITSINEELAKRMLVMGQVRDLTEEERRFLR